MERERKPDWEKWHMDLANSLEHDHPLMRDTVMSAAHQLRYMATSFILQLRWIKQLEADNAALRGQVESLEKQCCEFRDALMCLVLMQETAGRDYYFKVCPKCGFIASK